MAYWFCVKHRRVEQTPGDVCPPIDRLGPFATEADATRALEKAQERNEQWDNDPTGATSPAGTGSPSAVPPSDTSGAGPPAALAAASAAGAPRISPLPFAGMIGLACVLFLDLGSTIVLRWWAVRPARGGLARALRGRVCLVEPPPAATSVAGRRRCGDLASGDGRRQPRQPLARTPTRLSLRASRSRWRAGPPRSGWRRRSCRWPRTGGCGPFPGRGGRERR